MFVIKLEKNHFLGDLYLNSKQGNVLLNFHFERRDFVVGRGDSLMIFQVIVKMKILGVNEYFL